MSSLVRNYGFELPVFDNEAHIVAAMPFLTRHARLKRAILPQDVTKFIREVRIIGIEERSLKKALFIADSIFSKVAGNHNAQVVGHTWGLYPKPNSYEPYHRSLLGKFVPTGYILAAEVDVIRDARPLPCDQFLKFDSVPTEGYLWADIGSDQFVTAGGPESNQENLWLVDIEPNLVKI